MKTICETCCLVVGSRNPVSQSQSRKVEPGFFLFHPAFFMPSKPLPWFCLQLSFLGIHPLFFLFLLLTYGTQLLMCTAYG